MSITLDEVSCLLHLPIRGKLLDHCMIIRDEVVEMMVTYLEVDIGDSLKEVEDTWGCHARFKFPERSYVEQLTTAEQVAGNDEKTMQHRACALRAYMFYLVGTPIFVDKSAYYVDIVYFRYFIDLEQIHEYNWRGAYLFYLYSQLAEGCMWKTKQMTASCTLLTVIYLHPLLFLYHFHNICVTLFLIIHMYHFQAWILHHFPCISDGHMLIPTPRICHVLVHSSHSEKIRRHIPSECIFIAW